MKAPVFFSEPQFLFRWALDTNFGHGSSGVLIVPPRHRPGSMNVNALANGSWSNLLDRALGAVLARPGTVDQPVFLERRRRARRKACERGPRGRCAMSLFCRWWRISRDAISSQPLRKGQETRADQPDRRHGRRARGLPMIFVGALVKLRTERQSGLFDAARAHHRRLPRRGNSRGMSETRKIGYPWPVGHSRLAGDEDRIGAAADAR